MSIGEAARTVVDLKEKAILDALPDAAHGVPMLQLASRCRLIVYPNKVEILLFDGKPILEIHPVELTTIHDEHGVRMQATQKYRKIT